MFVESLEDRRLLAVSFEFNYFGGNGIGFNDPNAGLDFRTALESAAERLGNSLLHDATVQLDVVSEAFTGQAVAHAVSALPASPPGGGFLDTVVAAKIKGQPDSNGATADGELEVFFFSGSDPFTYVLDPSEVDADDELDFQAILTHELAHTIGFTSATTLNGEDDFGDGIDSPGTWRPYDQFLSDADGNRLIDGDPQSATAFRMDVSADGWPEHSVGGKGPDAGLFFAGPTAIAVYGAPVPLYSPATFSLASSVSHLDSEGALDNDPIFSPLTHVMTHAIVDRALPQEFTLVEKAIFADIGIHFSENTPPEITAPQDIEIEGNTPGGFAGSDPALDAFLSAAVATDLFDQDVTITTDVPDFLSIGFNTIVFTATDDSGNQATASAFVQVVDNTPPTIAVNPETVIVEATDASGATDVDLPFDISVSDLVDPNPSLDFDPGRNFPFGSTIVTISSEDFFSNSTTRNVQVVVQDSTAPELSLPLSLTIPANLPEGADLSNAVLTNLLDSFVSDAVDASPVFTLSPATIPLGITPVTFTATDDAGNSTSVQTTVTVAASNFTVTTLDDELDADPSADPADLSLREAISLANASEGTDAIFFDGGLSGSVLLDASLGQLTITESVSLVGSGPQTIAVDAQGNSRVIDVSATDGNVLIEGLTITGGAVTGEDETGGGIRFQSSDTLTVNNSVISGNSTDGIASPGGGIQTFGGNIVVTDTTITGNSTAGQFSGGGGVWINGGDLTVVRSTISGNSTNAALSAGAGLYVDTGTLTIIQSTVEDNDTDGFRSGGAGIVLLNSEGTVRDSLVSGNASRREESGGGGIRSILTTLQIVNSTVSGNSASTQSGVSIGGGVYASRSTVDVDHSTITGNQTPGVGGGIGVPATTVNTSLTISNSVVAGNVDGGAAPDFVGSNTISSGAVRYSLIGDNTGTTLASSQAPDPINGNLVGDPNGAGVIDPLLLPLADNGGLTRTHSLDTLSLAIDAGDPLFNRDAFTPSLTHDQRGEGFNRFSGNAIDIGAFESTGSVTITWNNPGDIAFGTTLNATQLNAISNVPGTFVYQPSAGTLLPVGDAQPLTVEFTPDDIGNLDVTSATVFIDVLRADPIITWENPDSIVFGTLLDDTQLNATANVAGTFVYSPAAGTMLDVGDDQFLSVTFTPIDTTNFNVVTASVPIDVTAAMPIITWADPDSITFGTPLSDTQLDATANVPGTFSYIPPAGVLLLAGQDQTLSVVFTPQDLDNFSPVNATVQIDVLRADPVIVWNDPVDIVAGTPLSATQLNATAGDLAGTFAFDPLAGVLLDVGQGQTLSTTFTPADTNNYNAATATTTINVIVAQDFGDAPSRYPVTLADGGARHLTSTLRIGQLVDDDLGGQPSDQADGDGDDDDGVTQIAGFVIANVGTTSSFAVEVSEAGKLDGWIDFNQDGDWDDSGEQIVVNGNVIAGVNQITVDVPSDALNGDTAARFRLSTAGSLLPTGPALDGEVEDYIVTLLDGTAAPEVPVKVIDGEVLVDVVGDQIVARSGGDDVFSAPLASVGRLNLPGTLLDDVFTLDADGQIFPGTVGLTVRGGGGSDTLVLLGEQSAFDFTDASIDVADVAELDLLAADATALTIDATTVASLSPVAKSILIQAGGEDELAVVDAVDWLMTSPININGRFIRTATNEDSGEVIQYESPADWQNFLQNSDINNDGVVSASDVLRIINELSRRSFSDETDNGVLADATSVTSWPGLYFDQNADGRVSALDALRVINELFRQSPPDLSGEAVSPVQPQSTPLQMIQDEANGDGRVPESGSVSAIASIAQDRPKRDALLVLRDEIAIREDAAVEVSTQPTSSVTSLDEVLADTNFLNGLLAS